MPFWALNLDLKESQLRRHLPLASASAVVFLAFASLWVPRQALGQAKAHIQARAQVVNAQASWGANDIVRDMLERAFRAVPLHGSPIDRVMKLKAAAGQAPDGIGVFFGVERRAGLTGSGARPISSADALADPEKLFGYSRLFAAFSYRPSATKWEAAEPERLVVYVHHLAN